jgi:hypothetical protein
MFPPNSVEIIDVWKIQDLRVDSLLKKFEQNKKEYLNDEL